MGEFNSVRLHTPLKNKPLCSQGHVFLFYFEFSVEWGLTGEHAFPPRGGLQTEAGEMQVAGLITGLPPLRFWQITYILGTRQIKFPGSTLRQNVFFLVRPFMSSYFSGMREDEGS